MFQSETMCMLLNDALVSIANILTNMLLNICTCYLMMCHGTTSQILISSAYIFATLRPSFSYSPSLKLDQYVVVGLTDIRGRCHTLPLPKLKNVNMVTGYLLNPK